jgi:hypothetical protein
LEVWPQYTVIRPVFPVAAEDMMFFFSLVLALFVLCMDSNAMSLCFCRQQPAGGRPAAV